MGIPSNIVIIWSGTIGDIPNGWFLCDGQNGTPSLLDRFIVGSGNLYTLDSTGGTKDSILPEHSHTVGSTNTIQNHSHNIAGASSNGDFTSNQVQNANISGTVTTTSNGSHSHTVNLSAEGDASGVDKNLPPYFALAYIMYGGE